MMSTASILAQRTVPTLASGLAATGCLLLASVAVRAGSPSAPRIQPLLRSWARAWLLPAGAKASVRGLEHIVQGQQYVVVANHLSNLDPMVMLACIPLPLRFLTMRELFDFPMLGGLLRRLGMIEVDRSRPDGASIARGVSAALNDGACIFVFAEGETSHDGTLGRFRHGAFSLAIQHGLPVMPITLHGTRAIWPPGSNAIRPGRVQLVIHEPIDTDGLDSQDTDALRDLVRSKIAEASLA